MLLKHAEIEQDGETVVNATTMQFIQAQARYWDRDNRPIGMEADDTLQESLLLHLTRRQDPTYRAGVEIHQKNYRRCRDACFREGRDHWRGKKLGNKVMPAQTARLKSLGIVERDPDTDGLEHEARYTMARNLLAHLDPDERTVVEMRFQQAQPSEIATALKRPKRDITETLTRALSKLRVIADAMMTVEGTLSAAK